MPQDLRLCRLISRLSKGSRSTDILLDDIPLHTGFLGGGEDRRPVEVAFADLRHDRFVGADGHIFEVQQRDAAFDFADPFRGISAAELDPVGVDFEIGDGGVGFLDEGVEADLAFIRGEFFEFEGVVVVGEREAELGQGAADLGEAGGEERVALGSAEGLGQ